MKTFLAISIGFHAVIFAAFSIVPVKMGRTEGRVIEVSYYQGKSYSPVKKITPRIKEEISPIIRAEIKEVKEELKNPETTSDKPFMEKQDSRVTDKPGTAEIGDGSGYSDTDPEIAAWFSLFKDKIERYKRYPRKALEEGSEGKTLLEITVEENGLLKNIRVSYSSGDEALDNEAVRTVKAASSFKPLPRKMGRVVTFRLPLKFEVRK